MKNLIVLFLILGSFAQAAENMHLIYVNGVAEKTVEPNMALVRLESWAKASTAAQAQEQQALQYEKIKKAASKFGVKKEDVQTEGFNVNPEYFYDQKNQTNKVTGYRVSHQVVITNRKVDETGNMLDSLITSKADTSGINIQSVSWDYDKKAVVENATLADAVKSARFKADELAKAAGVSIKAVHKIQFNSYAPPVAQPMYERSMMKTANDSVAPATEVTGGQIKVRVEVQMEFEI